MGGKVKKQIKYVCIGGQVRSRHDNDIHFIEGRRLPRLYGVDPQECICVNKAEELRGRRDLIHLRPDPTGEYEHPDKWATTAAKEGM
jgi:hypothetical protein